MMRQNDAPPTPLYAIVSYPTYLTLPCPTYDPTYTPTYFTLLYITLNISSALITIDYLYSHFRNWRAKRAKQIFVYPHFFKYVGYEVQQWDQ